jgi:hypothetical protein
LSTIILQKIVLFWGHSDDNIDMEQEEDVAKFNLRLPKDLYERVTARAQKNRRSVNNEIVVILDRVCDYEEKIDLPEIMVAESPGTYSPAGTETVVGKIVQKSINQPAKSAENNENIQNMNK